jgi:hypothetical protein
MVIADPRALGTLFPRGISRLFTGLFRQRFTGNLAPESATPLSGDFHAAVARTAGRPRPRDGRQ